MTVNVFAFALMLEAMHHRPLVHVERPWWSESAPFCAGKFYTLATGSNERRWSKMKPRLEQVVQSFEVQNRYDAAPTS